MSRAIDSASTTPVGVARRRPLTRPEASRVILLGTTSVVSGVLAAWLLTWVLFRAPGAVAAGWFGPSGMAGPVLPYQSVDALTFGGPLEIGTAPGTPLADVRRAFNDLVARGGSGPLVVYLSAPGFAHDGRPYFLPADEAAFVTAQAGEDALASVESVLEVLAADRKRPKLLILDAAQVSTDRDLGVFGNSFVHRLNALLESRAVPNLAVLSACAAGQESLASEADRRSIFAYYVARGLSGDAAQWDASGRVTTQGLARYVRAQVARSAESRRQAAQTPVLLGDTSVNFPLKTYGAPRPLDLSTADTEALAVLDAELTEAWRERDRLAELAPYRHVPLLWRRYLDGLLRTEHLIRGAHSAEAREVLDSTVTIGQRVARRTPGLPLDRAWSLALGRAHSATLPDAAREELDMADQAIQRAIDQLTGRAEIEEVIEAKGTTEPNDPGVAANVEAPDAVGNANSDQPAPPAPPVAKAQAKTAETRQRPTRAESASLTENLGGRQVPRYIEAQLAVWARLYVERGLGPAFEGRRALELQRAQDVRRLAERCAAVDERIARRIEPLLERADARRLTAQDHLFAPEGPATDLAARTLDEAERLYLATLEYATAEARALDRIQRIELELPYLGAWKSRRARAGLDPQFLAALLEGLEELAQRLTTDPGFPVNSEEGTTTLAAEVERATSSLAALAQRVGSAHEAQRREFLSLCVLAATSRGPARLAEIDDLLRVPTIPTDLRLMLRERVRTLSAGSLLTDEAQAAPAPELPISAAESEADPTFWAFALGLGRIECTLMALGGADASEVQALRSDLAAARGATTHAAVAFEAMERFNRRLRTLRATLAERARSVAGGPDRSADDAAIGMTLLAADRAARALPRVHTLEIPERSAPDEQYQRFLRHATLRRLGRRLVEDYAPEHARLLFNAARAVLETQGLEADVARAEEVARARLEIRPEPADEIKIGNDAVPMAVRLVATGTVPAGSGLIALRSDADRPLAVSPLGVADDSSGLSASELVPLGGGSSDTDEPPQYLLTRTDYSTEYPRFDLTPTLFYRGRIQEATAPVRITLDPAQEEIRVALTDPDRRGYGDQFLDHPTRGYLHYGTTLSYRVVLTNTTERELNLWVATRFDGEETKVTTLTIEPEGTNNEIAGFVYALPPREPLPGMEPAPGTPPPPPQQPGPNEAPLGRPRTMSVEVREGGPDGRSLSIPRMYEFHQLDVSQYATAFAHFTPDALIYKGVRHGRLRVIAQHLATDPVRGGVTFSAVISGNSIGLPSASKGQYAWFDWYFPFPYPEKVSWSVTAGYKVRAFTGEVPTNVAPVPPAATPPSSGPNL